MLHRILISALAMLAAVVATAETTTLKIATLAPEQSLWIQTFRKAAADIDKRTSGRVKFRLYAGGIHGDEQTVLRKIRSGQLHGGGFVGTGISAICPDVEVLQAPMQFRSDAEVDAALSGMDDYLRQQTNEHDFVFLSWVHLGFTHIFSKKPVDSLQALRDAKPWMIPEDQMSAQLFKQAGVSGIATPVSDVLTGLQSGLLETVASPPVAMVSLQWFTQISYHTDLPLLYSLGGFAVHKDAWQKLSAEDQKTVQTVMSRYFDALTPLIRKQNDNAIAAMNKRGIKSIPVPQAARDEFAETCAGVRKTMVNRTYSQEAADKVEAILRDFRAKQ